MKNRLMIALLAVVVSTGTALATDIGLTSVLYPEGKSVDVPISGTQRAPAATLSAKVKYQAGQSEIVITQKNLVPAVLFGGDIVSYVVWAVSTDGNFENLGEMIQAAGAYPIDAFFVFLNLLKRQSHAIAKFLLAQTDKHAAKSHSTAHMRINWI